MKKIKVGPLTLSAAVLGTDYFGTAVTEKDAFDLMDAYLAAGGTTLDTARMYANWLPGGDGASEKCIGAWLAATGNRKNITLITKGGHGEKGGDGLGHLHRAELVTHMEESLAHLRTTPDLYLVHRDNPCVEVGEIMETLGEFVKKGYTRLIGCSNWRYGRIREANAYAEAHGLPKFAVSEIQWSLALSDPEMQKDPSLVCMNGKEFGFYASSGMPVLAFSSQAKGYFARMASGEKQNEKALARFDCEENRGRAARVKEIAAELGVEPSGVVMAYITSQSFPACALVGCKKREQVADSLCATDLTLSGEILSYLEGKERFPGKFQG